VAGGDLDDKRLVMRLIRNIGGKPIDADGLREVGRLQGTGGLLTDHLPTPSEARRLLTAVQNQRK
jgi:predicted dinucleotide-binding enzyme